MRSKLVFLDLDGTIIDHSINDIPKSAEVAIKKAQDNGHTIVIATGRPPSLFYGVDKRLNITTFIAGNGRYVKHNEQELYHDYIDPSIVSAFAKDMKEANIDVAYETVETYAMSEKNDDIVIQFSHHFHLEVPKVIADFHKNNLIMQMVMFYTGDDFKKYEIKYPQLDFNKACRYGIDINTKGGMKDIGVEILRKELGFKLEDTIAVGDGYNDISMIQKVGIGVAMGNACQPLKDSADFVSKDCSDDGLFHAFKELNLI